MRSLFLVLIIALFGCQEISFSGKGKDVPTAGQVSIGFEQGDSFMVQQWLEIFHSQYPKATITPIYGTYAELSKWLVEDSLHGVFVHEKFNLEQVEWLKQSKNSTVNEIELGSTSVVFVVSKDSKIDKLDLSDLAHDLYLQTPYVKGENSKFKWVFPSRGSSEWITIANYSSKNSNIFVNNDENNIDSIDKNVLLNNNPGSHVKWFKSHQQIINYITRNPNAIGVVSLNHISDKKDSLTWINSKNVRVLPVGLGNGKYHYPFQSQISLKQYPFVQSVVSYEMQGYSGLITGFVLYCNSQAGQALMKKSGLLPKNYQGRKIELELPN